MVIFNKMWFIECVNVKRIIILFQEKHTKIHIILSTNYFITRSTKDRDTLKVITNLSTSSWLVTVEEVTSHDQLLC